MSPRLALAMSASALVVALLGSTPLGHALSSALPRNSVGPLQLQRNAVGPQKIAPNAVRASHVLNGSLLVEDFKAGQIPAGPKGDKGDKGDKGPPGLSELEVVEASTALDSTPLKSLGKICPVGKRPVGGGATVNPALAGLALLQSAPLGGTGWRAIAREIVAESSPWQIILYVICAKVS